MPDALLHRQLQAGLDDLSADGVGRTLAILEHLKLTRNYAGRLAAQLVGRYDPETTPVLLLRNPLLIAHCLDGACPGDADLEAVIRWLVGPEAGGQRSAYLRALAQRCTAQVRDGRAGAKAACLCALLCLALRDRQLTFDLLEAAIGLFVAARPEERSVIRQINQVRPSEPQRAGWYERDALARQYQCARVLSAESDMMVFLASLQLAGPEHRKILEALWASSG